MWMTISGAAPATAAAIASGSRTSPAPLSMPSATRASSYRDGCVGTPTEKPVTRAPSDWSHSASQAPLKPLSPVTRTRRSRQKSGSMAAGRAEPPEDISALGPFPPGSGARAPQLFEVVALAQRVHRLPEALVAVARKLTVPGERAHRLLLPDCLLALQIPADRGREHEKAAVGPRTIPARLLLELQHAVAIDLQRAEAPRRLHRGYRCRRPPLAVKCDQRRDVHVADAVAVGEAEVLLAHIGQNALQASPRHRSLARVDERNVPGLGLGAVDLHVALRQVEGDVAGVQV